MAATATLSATELQQQLDPHRAGANTTDRPRAVMTMIYMDENIRLIAPKNKNHITDIERWASAMQTGDVLASALNPVIFTR